MLELADIGRRIRAAREEVGISVDRIAQLLGTSIESVRRLEEGALDPLPGDYVLLIARELRKDFRAFISTQLDDVEQETGRIYRALNKPSHSDLLAIRRFVTFGLGEQEMEELLEVHRPPLPPEYPPPARGVRHIDQAIDVAKQERARLGLGDAPVVNVFEVLRSAGVRLFRHALADSQLSGLTILHPRAGVCVLVNCEEDLYRQFFSAAHEYGHVLFDRSDIRDAGCVVSYRYDAKQLREIRANSFAAEFLLPRAALARYRANVDRDLPAAVLEIGRRYRVNTAVVIRQLLAAGCIDDRTRESVSRRKLVIHRSEKVDPDMPLGLTPLQTERRQAALREGIDSAMLELMRRALVEGKITFSRFAEVLDLSITEARDFVHATGLAI